MEKSQLFFSLRWKVALLLGSVLLILHSFFSYTSYLNAKTNFVMAREAVQTSHVGLAKALTEDSFLALQQFASLVSSLNHSSVHKTKSPPHNGDVIDKNWLQWQLNWQLESLTLFDKRGMSVKSWGNPLVMPELAVQGVLKNTHPKQHIYCVTGCFQQLMTPLGEKSAQGALSTVRSFVDIIDKYKQASGSDIGILMANTDTEDANRHWPYKLSTANLSEQNIPVFEFVSAHYPISDFLNRRKLVGLTGRFFDVSIMSIPPQDATSPDSPAYFLLIDEVTTSVRHLEKEARQLWLYGLIGLGLVLLLLVWLLQDWLRRIGKLSQAFPLLLQDQYDQCREQLTIRNVRYGHDELDKLNELALNLVNQLQNSEQEVHGNTFELMEKSQHLAKERDFIHQLIEVAPVIILTQKLNGIILNVNQAGINGFETDRHSIVGKVFDIFLPESEREHLKKLNELRSGIEGEQLQITGFLMTKAGKQKETSWLHTVVKVNGYCDEAVILTLGIDVSVSKVAQEKMLRMATYDYVTGLSNRRKFEDDFMLELASAKRYGYQVALFYLDLDKFKVINDREGREAGDKALTHVATVLKEAMRLTDLLSRIGGDEFALIMPHADAKGVEHIAQKINRVLLAQDIALSGRRYKITASIGVAIFPLHGLMTTELLKNADCAMYQAKAAGHGQYRIFSPDSDYQDKLNLMLHWRETIEDAIANDKFILYYQPIRNLKTGIISHFECLIRLQKEDGQLIMPTDFINYAEELGLAGRIDRLVLKKVVQKHIELNRQGKDYKLTINLSGRLFNDVTIFDDISWLIKDRDVDPGKIIFEIAETAIVSNFAAADRLIAQINELGCLIAFDNFGVGFSSVYYLNRFPIAYVKIDGSFIRKIDKSDDDKVFVKALSGVAQAYGKKTVAESVESEEALTILKEIGIDFVQGYYIGDPAPLD
ncbi:Cyclic di-GMP phosphodiesterase Gmr [Crenothrix polyspora]|uniref:Cyclic di-GMP phosphodiesterase Gmr n=2 Tax=Crenothrix polyspora TaxID=360316 RepID=A0A1R4H0B7_9GAMM|nr:Cyclic di-GMP phosphodiesterase Gmr [Crenothrix polyspora]